MKDKLPNIGITIFTVMSSLAKEHNAINLGQGFPDFSCAEELKEFVKERIYSDYNQYAPMPGIRELRELLHNENKELYNVHYDVDDEITITSGATEALFNAISSLVYPGDEVIIFEPAYDSYVPVIQLNGGKVVPIPLMPPDFSLPVDLLKERITRKTKAIIINTPHNPIGKVWSEEEILTILDLIKDRKIYIISDEVYEHITFDGVKHFSIREVSELQERSFVIGSFGKSFHITGWKVGYAVAPKYLTKLFRKIHQFNVFCTSTPFQYAIADYINFNPKYHEEVKKLYQNKRDKFLELLKGSRFKPIVPKGTYFMLLDYSAISSRDDVEFAKFLTKEYKVTLIPISVFYTSEYSGKILRVCFAKTDDVLISAANILREI